MFAPADVRLNITAQWHNNNHVRFHSSFSSSDSSEFLDLSDAYPGLYKIVMQYLFPFWGSRLQAEDDVAIWGVVSTIARVVAVDETRHEVSVAILVC
jgi:hypothetical protein